MRGEKKTERRPDTFLMQTATTGHPNSHAKNNNSKTNITCEKQFGVVSCIAEGVLRMTGVDLTRARARARERERARTRTFYFTMIVV